MTAVASSHMNYPDREEVLRRLEYLSARVSATNRSKGHKNSALVRQRLKALRARVEAQLAQEGKRR